MKLLRLLPACLASLPALLGASPVDSRVSSATVYADRALVTRTAQVPVAAGENTLVFEHLPASLDERSLQFSARGPHATILDVNAATVFVSSAPAARVHELEEQLRALQKQGRTLDGRTAVLGSERDYVKRMLQAATAVPAAAPAGDAHGAPRMSLEEWQKLYGYSEEALGKIDTELQSIEEQQADLKDRRLAAERQLESLRGAGDRSEKTVTVRVAAAEAGTLDASLSYTLGGAGWTPSYDARLSTAERSVELGYYGLVRNATGEDWTGVSLVLSTARPSLGGAAPEPRPWIVDVQAPVVAAMPTAGNIMAKSLKAERDRAARSQEAYAAAPAFDAETLQARVEMEATSATFTIPGTVTVPSNDSTQRVPIASARLAADLRYEATPKALPTAFLSARTVNRTDYPLLAGPMNTFLDGAYVAASRVRTVMPGESFELQLGADEGISVKRKLVSRFAENTGLTGGGRRVTYEILVTVANNKKTTEHIRLREPLPVSRNEKIEVKLTSPEEKDVGTKESPREVMRGDDGILAWSFDLRGGERREVPIKVSVDYPADVAVTGLE